MKATSEQQLHFLARDVLPLLKAVVEGKVFTSYDDATVVVRMTGEDYRRAARLLRELEQMDLTAPGGE